MIILVSCPNLDTCISTININNNVEQIVILEDNVAINSGNNAVSVLAYLSLPVLDSLHCDHWGLPQLNSNMWPLSHWVSSPGGILTLIHTNTSFTVPLFVRYWFPLTTFPTGHTVNMVPQNRYVIWTKFSSVGGLKVVFLTTCKAASDKNFIKITPFPFQRTFKVSHWITPLVIIRWFYLFCIFFDKQEGYSTIGQDTSGINNTMSTSVLVVCCLQY